MNQHLRTFFALSVLALVFGTNGRLSAQILSTAVASQTGGETLDLQSAGPTDWVQFGVSGTAEGFSLANEQSGGSVGGLDTVGPVSVSDDTYGGRTEITQTIDTSYSNGTSPASSSADVEGTSAGGWVIQSNYGGFTGDTPALPADGATLSFTIDFNKAISGGTIVVGGNTFAVDAATFTAALNGGNTKTASAGYGPAEQNDIFTIDLGHVDAGSTLTLSWEMVTGDVGSPLNGAGAYDNVSLSGVALDLTAVPEPSIWMMVALAGIVLLIARRSMGTLRSWIK
jgi:hypothetical protein